MNIKLITGDALKKAVKGFGKKAASWTETVASIGSSVVYHAAKHGDVTLLNKFYEHLPAAYTSPFKRWLQSKGVSAWLSFKSGEFLIKKDSKELREAFVKDFQPEDWTDFKVKKEKEWDEESLLRSLLNLEKKAGALSIPEDVLRHINEAATIVEQIVAARKEGNLKKVA